MSADWCFVREGGPSSFLFPSASFALDKDMSVLFCTQRPQRAQRFILISIQQTTQNASGPPASIFQSPPSREATFLTVFTPLPHRERTFSVCEVVSRVGRPPFSSSKLWCIYIMNPRSFLSNFWGSLHAITRHNFRAQTHPLLHIFATYLQSYILI